MDIRKCYGRSQDAELMGMDRFVRWGELPSWQTPPTIDRIAQVCQNFLGPRWIVRITDPEWIVAECEDSQTFALVSEHPESSTLARAQKEHCAETTRGFEVCFMGENGKEQTSVITRQADEFTCALADRFARIIARWWGGEVEWPS